MATLLRFTDAYNPATAFYTGTGATELVPDIFPIAINGRPYMLDIKSNQFTRQFDARVRDSVDQSTEPGESALNPQGLWRRSQSSWHYGAGQQYSDTADAEAYRFYTSKGVDVWTKGRLTLLKDTTKVYSSANSNLYATTADGRLYGSDGQNVKYTTDFTSVTTVTGTAASDIYSITSNGYNVFYSYANGDIDQTNAGVSTSSAYISGFEAGYLSYFNGRIMVAGQGVYTPHATNLVSSGYLRSGIYRWGVPDAKFIPKLDVRCLPLEGSVQLSVASDGGDFFDFAVFDTPNARERTVDGSEAKVFEAEIKITLNRAAVTSTGPTITRWMARAYAAPLRSQIFQVPIIMHHKLNLRGREYYQDVDEELRLLRDLVENPRVVTYQENLETFAVVVENVQMQVQNLVYAHSDNDHEGTAIVVMRSVR